MKKILVIGLALAMMTSTAFAADLIILKPGDQIIFQMEDFRDQKEFYVSGKSTKQTPVDAEGPTTTAVVINPSTYNISTTKPAGKYVKLTDQPYVSYLGAPWSVGVYGQDGDDQDNNKFIGDEFGIDTRPTGKNNSWSQRDLDNAKKKVDMLARHDIQKYDFTAENFTVTVNAPVGKNLIKNYEFDGTGNLIVNLKTDYKLPSKGKPDLIISDVTVKSKRDIKKMGDNNTTVLYKNRTFVANDTVSGTNSVVTKIGANAHFSVGVETYEEIISAGNEVDLGQYQNGEWVKFTTDGVYTGDVRFDGGNIQVKGKVYNGDVVNFTYNAAPTDAAIKVIQNNPLEANIIVHNIVAKNFKTGFTVSIPGSSLFGAEADANGDVEVLSLVAANNKKLYLLSNTGVLTAAPFVYNNTTGAWEGRLPAQGGTILISDVALKGVTAGTTTGNPSTGFGIDFSSAVVK